MGDAVGVRDVRPYQDAADACGYLIRVVAGKWKGSIVDELYRSAAFSGGCSFEIGFAWRLRLATAMRSG